MEPWLGTVHPRTKRVYIEKLHDRTYFPFLNDWEIKTRWGLDENDDGRKLHVDDRCKFFYKAKPWDSCCGWNDQQRFRVVLRNFDWWCHKGLRSVPLYHCICAEKSRSNGHFFNMRRKYVKTELSRKRAWTGHQIIWLSLGTAVAEMGTHSRSGQ